jgi:hypothetical protein
MNAKLRHATWHTNVMQHLTHEIDGAANSCGYHIMDKRVEVERARQAQEEQWGSTIAHSLTHSLTHSPRNPQHSECRPVEGETRCPRARSQCSNRVARHCTPRQSLKSGAVEPDGCRAHRSASLRGQHRRRRQCPVTMTTTVVVLAPCGALFQWHCLPHPTTPRGAHPRTGSSPASWLLITALLSFTRGALKT